MSGDTLVNAETGEIIAQCTPTEARWITNRLRTAIGVATELYVEAYERRAWAALGHANWDAYCAAEFGDFQLKLPREERDEAIQSLRAAGLSIRAIAATGVASKNTVERTIAASGVPNGDTSTVGTDGKTYPASESAAVRAARERREREAAEADPVDFGKCTAGFDCNAKATAADGMCAWHRGKRKAEQDSGAGGDAPAAPDGPQQDPPPAAVHQPHGRAQQPADAPEADTDGTGQPAPHPDGEAGDAVPPAASPALPSDWRDRVARSTHLLGCPIDRLRPLLTDDDRIDLLDLHTYIADLLELNA